MKKIQRFLTMREVRLNNKEFGIIDFKVVLDRKTDKKYLTEDGEYDFTMYKVERNFNDNMLKSVHPDFYRNNYEQLKDYGDDEELLYSIIDYLNKDEIQFITI